MKIVLIEWEDSSSVSGWHKIDPEYDRICRCISIGLLCSEDKEQIVLSQSKSNFGHYGDAIAIPKSCIERIRYLGVK